jgi:two-component system sensor histidine kinase GlrK
MKRWVNRLTLTQQWVFATLLAILPLLLAIGYAGWSLTVQAREQRSLLLSINVLNNLDAAVARQIAGLERAARQFYLIGEPRLYEIYEERLLTLRGYQRDLAYNLPENVQLHNLSELVQLTADIGSHLRENLQTTSEVYLNEAWREVNQKREAFSDQIERIAEQSIRESEEGFEVVVRRLLLIGSLAIPGTVFLISLSTITIVKPLWRLASAIHRLGHHRWDKPVTIEGPADFVALGGSLEWMREQLLISDRQKEAFMRHITHELKSPLAAIVQAESLLSDQIPGPINDSQRNVLRILRQNANNLSSLIQQLLNYNAVKHSLKPERSVVDVRALWERLRHQHMAVPANADIHWLCEGQPDTIESDYACLEMILSNLLSNACGALNGAGEICVRWGKDSGYWWLEVADTGPGIDPEEIGHIFKPFFQGKERRQGPLKGSGIGLSIVQECVHTLGGSIEVKSQPGDTRFVLHFPLTAKDSYENR